MAVRLTKDDRRMLKRMSFVRELLKEFGLRLYGWSDPGGTAYFADKDDPRNRYSGPGYCGEPVDFSPMTWQWLEPLLVELREHRRKNRRRTNS